MKAIPPFLTTIWRPLTSAVLPRGRNTGLTVLFFHRVLQHSDPLQPDVPTVEEFERLLTWIARQFSVLQLSEALARLRAGSLPPGCACITFDDGYADNRLNAAPALLRAGLPATFFIATAFLDGGIMWNDSIVESVRRTSLAQLVGPGAEARALDLAGHDLRRAAILQFIGHWKREPYEQRSKLVAELVQRTAVELPADLMMTSSQLKELDQMGFEIGAHTRTHPILTRLSDEMALAEIAGSKFDLEAILSRTISLFAYPNGRCGDDFDQRHVDMVQAAGFEYAFSTEPGVVRVGSDSYSLPRFTPWDREGWKFNLRLIRNAWTTPSTPSPPLPS